MIKRVLALSAVLAVLATACSSAGAAPELDLGEGIRFVPEVVDSAKDVGRSPSIVVDAEGRPLIAYLGFEQVLAEGEIADDRLLHMPAVPNVLFANTSEEGFWEIGAVAWIREALGAPVGDPALQPRDKDGAALEPVANASVAAATDKAGTVSIAWSQKGSLRYAKDTADAFVGETVTSGETSGVSIAVDDAGVPWVAYYRGNRVEVSTLVNGRWTARTIGSVRLDPEMTAARTAIVPMGDAAAVAYTDGSSPILASLGADEDEIRTDVVEPRGGGLGMSIDASGDEAVMSYYTALGGVRHAHGAPGGPFDVSEVVPDPSDGEGSIFGWGTGTVVAEDGSDFVTWHDLASDSVKLARHDGNELAAVDLAGTLSGVSPTITLSPEGEPMVAWYDPVNQNLAFGRVVPKDAEIAVAIPSPSPVAEEQAAPAPVAECEPTVLDVAAPVNASTDGFDPTCLAAKAGKDFSISFTNADATPHNVAVYTTAEATDPIFENTEPVVGGASASYDIKAQKPGTYFFNCYFHPQTMTGSLVVA